MKVPQLRDVYKRTARAPVDGLRMSGFGIFHDGSVDSVFAFLGRPFFRELSRHEARRRELERFVLAFDTGTAPAVGWSRTVSAQDAGSGALAGELDLLEQQVAAHNCDLVARGRLGGAARGFVFDPERGEYLTDDPDEDPLPRAELLGGVRDDDALTFLGVPPGSGRRMGIDRDGDGVLDREARDRGR